MFRCTLALMLGVSLYGCVIPDGGSSFAPRPTVPRVATVDMDALTEPQR